MRAFLMTTLVLSTAAAFAAGGEEGVEPAEEDIFPGDPIIITAIGEAALESEVPFGITAVTADDLQLLAAGSLAEGLVRAEGVYVREYGGTGANATLSMRGGFANQTLVMVDGEPMNSHQGGDVDFNAIALGDVERVEVMAGPSSALYGANATAGVVNVITRGIPEEAGITFRGDYGSYNDAGTAAEVGVPFGRMGVTGGGDYRHSNGFRENDDYEGKGGYVKLSYAPNEEATLSIRGRYHASALGVPGSLSLPSPLARQQDDFRGLNAGFDGPLSEALSANGGLYFKRQERRYVDRNPQYPTDDTHKNDAGGGRAAFFYQLLKWNRLALGGEYEKNKTGSTTIGKRAGTTWAVFGQEDLRFDELTTVFGVRYDSSGIYGEAVSPRLGVRYRFNDYVSARASGGRGFRAPTFDELFWPDTGFGGGNPDLKPEYCWSYEFGPTLRWNRYFKVDVVYFHSSYEDLISGWPPENVARAYIRGGEVGVQAAPVPPMPGLQFDASATFLQTKDRDTGEQLDYRPAHAEFAELRYRRDFGGGAFAVTPSVSTEIVGQQQYTTYPDKDWLGAYALLNARLAFRAYYVEFYVAGKNLGDKTYQTIYDYPMPGRTFSAGFIADF
jgi:vitamin B12 transporter